MSTTYTARRTVLDTIYNKLAGLVTEPPRMHNNSYKPVDLTKIDKELLEVRVFWDSYLKLTKIEEHRYNLTNLEHSEQELYLTCKWYLSILETMIKEGIKP